MASDYYDSLQSGQVLHYNHGFNSWVRCVVVSHENKWVLLPVALVGEWHQSDLWHRNQAGKVRFGYYVEKIKNRNHFTPHESNIYEHNPSAFKTNPTTLVPLSLTPPALTEEKQKEADKWAKVERVRAFLLPENLNNVSADEVLAGLFGLVVSLSPIDTMLCHCTPSYTYEVQCDDDGRPRTTAIGFCYACSKLRLSAFKD